VEATVRAQEALRAGGVQGAVISVQERGGETTVQVRYNSRAANQAGLQAEQDTAARLVWENATVPLDVVKVTPDDNPTMPAAQTRVYSRADLAARFGDRPATLDRPPALGGPRATAFGFVSLIAGLMVLGIAAALAWVFLDAKRRRRRALAAATAWPAPGPADQPAPGGRHEPAPGAGPGQRPARPARPGGMPGQAGRGPRRGAEPPPGSWPAPPEE
jgi:hypothetical protein